LYAKVEPYLERKRVEEAERAAEEQIKEESRRQDAVSAKAREEQARQVVVRTYRGSQESAAAQFRSDAAAMAAHGWVPTTQSWAPGAYSCGAFLLALLLCFVVVGFLVFIYMLIVKPDGTLSVTYEWRAAEAGAKPIAAPEEKTCPMCAEQVKAAAQVCRFCGHRFA